MSVSNSAVNGTEQEVAIELRDDRVTEVTCITSR